MISRLLLPNKYKKAGWCLLIPAIILGVVVSITGYEPGWLNTKVFAIFIDEPFGQAQYFIITKVNITNTIIGVAFIVGAIFVGFSKESREDEFMVKLRLSSLLWAVWVNYSLLLIAFLFVYGTAFFTVMIYNMFTVLIIFIVRFNYLLFKYSKTLPDEK